MKAVSIYIVRPAKKAVFDFLMNLNNFIRVQVLVQKNYYFEFKFAALVHGTDRLK